MMTPLVAEIIGGVEYALPTKIADQWKIGCKMESGESTTFIYIPIGATKQNTAEFFGANANKYPSNLENILSFKASLAKQFPHLQVDVEILEKGKDSLLYEWIGREKKQEKIHGWGRAFSIGNGTVVLSYQTEEISKVPNARLDWLPVLKQAIPK
jgi:hypothetical protein